MSVGLRTLQYLFFFFNGADEMKTAKFGVVAAMTISESGMCIYTASHTRK